MWTRVELKERAKAALRRNYWKIVLVSSLLLLLGCGSGGYTFYQMNGHTGAETDADEEGDAEGTDMDEAMDEKKSFISVKTDPETGETVVHGIGGVESVTQNREASFSEVVVVAIIAVVIIFVMFLVLCAAVIAVDIFLINPTSVGGCRFMVKSVEDVAQVKEIAYGFDHSYRNVVKVLFFRDLYILLWTLLFVIPGIVKMYQYYMVPYILTEYPDMDYRDVLRMSRDMMEGNKWKTFVLGLSFILWDFLGAATFGIVEIFYVQPYRHLTSAALYCELRRTSATLTEDRYGL